MSEKVNNNYVQNPLKEKVLTDISNREETARQRVEEKQAQYNIAMKQLNIFQAKKYEAYSKIKPGNDPNNKRAKAEYAQIASQTFNCEVDADILRSSLQSSLSYYSKTSQSIFMANSILGS